MNKYLKFVFAALIIAAGVYLMMNRNIGWGIVLVILSAVPILLFFKNEYILAAFWYMRKQNMVKASHWLSKITNYETQLHKSQYGYFHYLQGLTLAQENPAKVEPYMKKALEFGLNMKHDRAMATLNIAAGAMQKGRRQEAQKLLEEAKRLDTAGMMTDQIKMLKDQLKMPSMQKHMHNPNMRQRGKFG
jgi:tetratricopeptide (TPR) repeat protein